MKKAIFAIMAIAAGVPTVMAQKISEKNVPSAVKTEFQHRFPKATALKWEMEDKNVYEAVFKLNGEELSANFSKEGRWNETEKEIKFSALPKAVSDAVKAKYPKAKIKEVAEVENFKNEKFFDIDVLAGNKTYALLINRAGEITKTTVEK